MKNKLLNKSIYIFCKNLIDKFFAILIIIIISPLLAFLSILILIFLGKPILFIQDRPGFKARPFKIIKFRTMKNLYDKKGNLIHDKFRLSKFGKILRSTSLDELPTLINILKGEMSFVGPRPLLMKYLSIYTADQLKRHDLKPGITGLAQISGRNSISWKDKFLYDLRYIKEISFILDLKILMITFAKVFMRKDINSNNNVTSIEFNGNN